LSIITRCPQTFAQDGQRIPVTFTATDRFCLDGQRLMAVKGTTYGAPGSIYRTERESFSNIVAIGQVNGAPDSFTVQTRSGLTLTYGVNGGTQNAVLPVQWVSPQSPATAAWALMKVADRQGNYYTVTYNVAGTPLPGPIGPGYYDFSVQRIDYTANSNSGRPAYNSVQFGYGPRILQTGSNLYDVIAPVYQAGTVTNALQSRLTSISVYGPNTSGSSLGTAVTLLRTYNITYNHDNTYISSGNNLVCSLQGFSNASQILQI
jgi:hypothetical protein